jgi:hypothetical protein
LAGPQAWSFPPADRECGQRVDPPITEARKPQPAPTPQLAASDGAALEDAHRALDGYGISRQWISPDYKWMSDMTVQQRLVRVLESHHIDVMQDDIGALLRALKLSDHARDDSCHGVIHHEIIPAIGRLFAAAPPAATPARERLRKAMKGDAILAGFHNEGKLAHMTDELREMYAAAEAVLNEPEAADGWESMLRELYGKLRDRRDSLRAVKQESGDTTRATHIRAWANGLNEAMLEIDRLLSRSPAAQAKEAT